MTTTNYQFADISVGQSQKEATNNEMNRQVDAAFGSKVQITVTTANVALSDLQHNENVFFEFIGVMDAGHDVTFKGRNRFALVMHSCTGAQNITLKAGTGAGGSVVLAPGDKKLIYVNGSANKVEGPFS